MQVKETRLLCLVTAPENYKVLLISMRLTRGLLVNKYISGPLTRLRLPPRSAEFCTNFYFTLGEVNPEF